MFSRFAAISVAALPVLAAATPVDLEARQSCSTGAIQCCQQVQSVSDFRDPFPCLTPMLILDTRYVGQRRRCCCHPRSLGHRTPGYQRPRRPRLLPDQRHWRGHWQCVQCQCCVLRQQQRREYRHTVIGWISHSPGLSRAALSRSVAYPSLYKHSDVAHIRCPALY